LIGASNSPFIVEQSQKTARRILAQTAAPEPLIRNAYTLILNRAPTATETQHASAFLKAFGAESPDPLNAAAALCQTLFATAEFRYLY